MTANALVPLQPAALVDGGSSRLSSLVGSFLAGRNERTLRAYRQDLEDFRTFTGAGSLDEASRFLLSRSHGEANALALDYKADLLERGLQTATVNRRLAAVRSLVKLAKTVGLVPWTLDVENMRTEPYRDTRGPGRSGFRRLLDEVETRTDAKGRRDRAVIRLLYDLALRRGEVVSLDLEDVDLDAGTVTILGKGRTQKELRTLPGPTKAALRDWVEVRGREPGPLFTNYDRAGKGERLTGTSLYRIVQDWGKRAGLPAVRPHGLRHAAITEALDLTNGNVRAVQRFSRHLDVRVLNRYDDNRTDVAGEIASLVAGRA